MNDRTMDTLLDNNAALRAENATLAGLGLRWQLWYLESAEVAAAGVT